MSFNSCFSLAWWADVHEMQNLMNYSDLLNSVKTKQVKYKPRVKSSLNMCYGCNLTCYLFAYHLDAIGCQYKSTGASAGWVIPSLYCFT